MRSRIVLCLAAILVLSSLIVLIWMVQRDGPAGSSAVADLETRELDALMDNSGFRFRQGVYKIDQSDEERARRKADLEKLLLEVDQAVRDLERSREANRLAEQRLELLEEELVQARRHLAEFPDFAGPARRRFEAGDSHPAGLVQPPRRD